MRAFFAVDLPIEVKQETAGLIALLRNIMDKDAVRWTLPKNLHITLRFLAHINPDNIHRTLQEVGKLLRKFPSFEIELSQLELFPSAKHPKFVALLTNPHDLLRDLSNKIGEGLIAANYPIEKRVFRGHLTLGRIKQTIDHLHWSEVTTLPEPIKFPVTEITFFSSQPTAKGSNYTPLARLPLSL